MTIHPGTTPQNISAILVTNLVNIDFSVIETTITDEYQVSLNITYATDLIKPTLMAYPVRINLSFFPEETQEGHLTITNTSNHAAVRNLLLDTTQLDLVDSEIKIVFLNESQVTKIDDLAPGETVTVAFRAMIQDPETAKLNNRYLGNIIASGQYTYSINAQAFESTTKTPIPVFYYKPSDLNLPSITFVNDETGGIANDLEYRGNTYRLEVESNRNIAFQQDGQQLKTIAEYKGVLVKELEYTPLFNEPGPLTSIGDKLTFDILGLEEILEQEMSRVPPLYHFLKIPHYLNFNGQWADRTGINEYRVPISIITIREREVVYSECIDCSSTGIGIG